MNERWLQFLQTQGAQFDAGRVTGYSASRADTAALASRALVDLSHYGLISVAGDDAATFMHAQFTNDVKALEVGDVQWNGWCSPKGRLLVTFLLWREPSRYLMLLPAALQPAIQKRLGMFVLRSKVTIADQSATLSCLGIIDRASLNDPSRCLSAPRVDTINGGVLISLSDARQVIVADAEYAIQYWQQHANASAVGANEWTLGHIRAGTIDITPETQEAYVPQMVNFELSGGVSFKKGCYPGQEIVARTQYRGILKRRMVRVEMTLPAGTSLPAAGASVYSPDFGDQAAGSIALIAATTTAAHAEALVVAQIESIQNDSLYLDSIHTIKLTQRPLPYSALPADAAA
jgi:tRNA-modifying protein YgfZ